MVKVIESCENSLVFGSRISDSEYFRFGKAKNDANHASSKQKLLYKADDFKLLFSVEDSKFIFGAQEDSVSGKSDCFKISDYLGAKHDTLLAAADLQSKSLQ